MTLEEAIKLVKACEEKMTLLYGAPVFNEWIIIQISGATGTTHYYTGPRPDSFQKSFKADVKDLYGRLVSESFSPGEYEFVRSAIGTAYEAFMVLGNQLFLLCNHTERTMEDIAKNPKWLSAQVPFNELTEKFRRDPVRITQGK